MRHDSDKEEIAMRGIHTATLDRYKVIYYIVVHSWQDVRDPLIKLKQKGFGVKGLQNHANSLAGCQTLPTLSSLLEDSLSHRADGRGEREAQFN